MLDALGPDDPKTQTVAQPAATVATHDDVPVTGGGGGGARRTGGGGAAVGAAA